jgi:hypothetical protein
MRRVARLRGDSSSRADTPQRDEKGKPYVLESVLQAEDILHKKKLDKEYLPITVGPVNLPTVLRRAYELCRVLCCVSWE